jgi:N6-L-threonylcarbamoyladenine synthase
MKRSDLKIRILAIETSCDETAAAIIEEKDGHPVILSNIISSQIDLHAKTGGVVPEVASRAHLESIIPVISEALLELDHLSSSMDHSSKHLPNVQLSNNQMNAKCLMADDNYQEAISLLDGITHIAVTAGPGLVGSLLVGLNAAKALAYAKDLPAIPINHIEGHIYSAFSRELNHLPFNMDHSSKHLPNVQLSNKQMNAKCQMTNDDIFPLLALTVSGGHTSITLMKDHGKYEQIGATLDDAVGEAYDKVARLLELGYPGGPIVSKLANQFRIDHCSFSMDHSSKHLPNVQLSNKQMNTKCQMKNGKLALVFPRPILNDGTFNFSFSGLKTAVLQKVKEISNPPRPIGHPSKGEVYNGIPLLRGQGVDAAKAEICFAFEESVAEVLSTKLSRAIDQYQPKAVIFAGGVSANQYLASQIELRIKNKELGINFLTPPKEMTGDNAAMIGLAAYYRIKKGTKSGWQDLKVDSNMEL